MLGISQRQSRGQPLGSVPEAKATPLLFCFPRQWVGSCLLPASFHKLLTSGTKPGSCSPCLEHLYFQSPCSRQKSWLSEQVHWGPVASGLLSCFSFISYLWKGLFCFWACFCLFGFLFLYFSHHYYLCVIKDVDQNMIFLHQFEQQSFCLPLWLNLSPSLSLQSVF